MNSRQKNTLYLAATGLLLLLGAGLHERQVKRDNEQRWHERFPVPAAVTITNYVTITNAAAATDTGWRAGAVLLHGHVVGWFVEKRF